MTYGMLIAGFLGACGFFASGAIIQLIHGSKADQIPEIAAPPVESGMPVLPALKDVPVDPEKQYYPPPE